MQNRAGKTALNLSGETSYESFVPQPLPPNPTISVDSEMQSRLIRAHAKLALLNGLADRIPNKNLFLSAYVRKEALVSSQIEGTQCTLDDIFNPSIDETVNADVSDVVNYVRAVNFAVERLKTLPLCNRLIRETHQVLMNSVRGCDKTPGEFRSSQNWIGGVGSTLKNARYIPPNPQDMEKAIFDLETFCNEDDGMDALVKASLIHYQFETIHPFLDGNGRVGRLLITLFLMQAKEISSPILYLSCFLKSNRVEYYDRMSEVRKSGDYEQWVKFFLLGVEETATDAIETFDRLTKLHEEKEKIIKALPTRAYETAQKLFEYCEKNPIVDVAKTALDLGYSRNTVSAYLSLFCEKNVLRETGKKGKAKIFSYEDYLTILRKDT